MRLLDELGLGQRVADQGDRQDPHERAVPIVPPARRTGLLRGYPTLQAAQRLARRVADVEGPVPVGGVRTPLLPGKEAPPLVRRIEASREQRVEQREGERAVVAPGARRLAVGAVGAEAHLADRGWGQELVGHPDGVADEMPPDRACQAQRQLHVRECGPFEAGATSRGAADVAGGHRRTPNRLDAPRKLAQRGLILGASWAIAGDGAGPEGRIMIEPRRCAIGARAGAHG